MWIYFSSGIELMDFCYVMDFIVVLGSPQSALLVEDKSESYPITLIFSICDVANDLVIKGGPHKLFFQVCPFLMKSCTVLKKQTNIHT